MNFLSIFRKKPGVMNDILTNSVIQIMLLSNQIESDSIQLEKTELLKNLGFDRSKDLVEYKKTLDLLLKYSTFYETMCFIRQSSPEAFFIPTEAFLKILKEYGLVCGTFDKYKGDVPLDILRVIDDVRHNFPSCLDKKIKLCQGVKVTIDSYYTYDTARINKIIDDEIKSENFKKRYFNDTKYIPCCYNEGKTKNATELEMYTDLKGKVEGRGISVSITEQESENLLICAPTADMEPNFLNAEVIKVVREVRDPLIISMSKDLRGVVIHTGWGMEMKNEVILKYKDAVNRFINAFGPFKEKFSGALQSAKNKPMKPVEIIN